MVCKPMAALVAAFLCGTALAAGARLFNSTDFVPPANEAATLNSEEAAKVAKLRGMTRWYKSVQVIRLNRASLAGGSITIVNPRGESREFVAVARPGMPDGGMKEAGLTTWYGECAETGENMQITHGADGLVGNVYGPGRVHYSIGSLPGSRFYTLIETLPQQMKETGSGLDANPPILTPQPVSPRAQPESRK